MAPCETSPRPVLPNDTRDGQCDKHGPFASLLQQRQWTGCPACRAAHRAQEDAQRHQEAEQRQVEHTARRLRAAGLVGRFEDATFDTFKATTKEQRAVVTACREYAQEVTQTTAAGLLLLGWPGTGKTHLASAIVRHVVLSKRELIHRGQSHMVERTAEIITARDLIRRLRATWKRDAPETEEEVITDMGADTEVLALDEVGASFGTEAEQVQLLDVIDLRYRLRRPTVIVSNLTPTELKAAVGERAFDRLREGAKLLQFTWPSHRGPKP